MKKHLIPLFFVVSFLFANNQTLLPQNFQKKGSEKYHAWWNDRFPDSPLKFKDAKALPLISVKGNRFVNQNGDTIQFHGLAIADPDKLENQGHWSKEIFTKAKELGTMIIRIPVHPVAWRERTPEKYLKLLDQAVEWCTELDMYIDIDWHSIGNLEEGLFQDPMYNTSLPETFNFWRIIAGHFRNINTIAFYELFNEPSDYFGQLGNVSWEDWKKINEDLIKLIRAFDKEKIPLVAGFDWAYDLTPLKIDPLDAEGIGYVTHPYPSKCTPPYELKWEEDFGFAANKYPVFATELGFTLRTTEENLAYGKAIINYFNAKHISWMWWVFDPQWYPKMIESWKDYTLTENGKFYEQAAKGLFAK